MFQKKIGELFTGMPYIFGTAGDILITRFDEQGNDHDQTLDKIL